MLMRCAVARSATYRIHIPLMLSDDHRMIVEPACGATLAAIYSDVIPQLQREGKLGAIKSAFVVVCGGASVTLSALDQWKQQFGL